MPPKYRTVVAIEISAAVKERGAALICELDRESTGVRWVKPESMHLTLAFLGEVLAEGIPDVCRAVDVAVEGRSPFGIRLAGVGAFPNRSRPRIVWIGLDEGAEQIVEMEGALSGQLGGLGFPRENRAFTPHLTIGRVREVRRGAWQLSAQLAAQRDYEAGRMQVRELIVFSSELGPQGPTYTPLGRSKLSG